MKRLFFFFLMLTALACTNQKKNEFTLIEHLPEDSEIIIISPDLKELITVLGKNEIINLSDLPFKNKISDELKFIQYLNFPKETGLSFSNFSSDSPEYTLITERDFSILQLDSIQNKSVESIEEENLKYQKVNLEGTEFFMYETGNTTIFSNSKQRIINIAKESSLKDPAFTQAYNASDPNKTSVFINHHLNSERLSYLFSEFSFPSFTEFAQWSVLDLDISNSQIRGNGISLSKNGENLLNTFSGNSARNSEIGKICPEDFASLYSIQFSSFEKIHRNLQQFRKDSISNYPPLLDQSREIGIIRFENSSSFVLNAIEIETAKEQLAGFGEKIENHRGSDIFQLNRETGFQAHLSALMDIPSNKVYTILDHFIIFSEDVETLKKHITDFQNSDVLSAKSYYTDLLSSLSSESSMLFISRLPDFLNNLSKSPEDFNLRNNSMAAVQVINEGDFAHLHTVFSNPEKNSDYSNGAEQISSFKLNAPLVMAPQFFKNHRTDQKDIVVQDENNNLYLISNKGNIFWKKELDSKVTSPIYQVDLFKNGNQQLAFSTGYHMEVLDRDGNKVKGYPIKFNEPLTQPLAVFDYDNNRNYRFVMVQKRRAYMVGPKGKAIKGFDFEKAGSNIIQTPKHIRLGTKDYIMVAEESGKLNILSRQGNIRVPLSENLDFSENEWYGYSNNFISSAAENVLITISQQGQISRTNLGLAENNRIVANDNNLVYLNENQLSINGTIVELDFGLYTDPQLFELKNRTLVSITDLQAQKVYVFNENAQLLDGFPVYGNSKIDIANADLDSRLELIVKGEENEILYYKL